ncbi:hypothetical protein GOP47_0000033 [Adiantum capillus-veneris]|uniref:Protein ABA DEFICIENT 4, chloroplastic n=1 Tax=Adiantum capillus-veneris TaxID=13818 RepID=A0A9D4VCJ7_ADICA|nr:hypothetical protein GOP47_0000033 [Adiantum capillus-veneris]
MALWLCSQSALCSPQISDSIKSQAHLRWMPDLSKQKVAFDNRWLNNLSSGNGQLAGERVRPMAFNGSNSMSKMKRSRTAVSASMPSLAPAAVQVASRLFTFGTAFVVPFYTVMILAPHATWTKKLVESSVPYVVLGVLYAYLLILSWSPDTLPLMFASKYWLPELPGITRMFSSTLTVASAWLHLLAVDLFAGRQIYLDGLQHAIETRHSLTLCLLFCPVGMVTHFITKAMVQLYRKANSGEIPDIAELYS